VAKRPYRDVRPYRVGAAVTRAARVISQHVAALKGAGPGPPIVLNHFISEPIS
jgi:hypothetical protein